MKVAGLTKQIEQQQVLENISFELKPGEITALIGRNGVGKTTLFSVMTGIFLPDAGDVAIGGKSIYQTPAVKKELFLLEDNMNYFNSYSVKSVVKLYNSIYTDFDEDFFYRLMTKFELPIQAKIISFSKGRKALFFMILAFSLNVRYLLLDEPLDGLDVLIKQEILQFIKDTVSDRGTSVMIASHRLDELEKIADRVIILKGSALELDIYLQELRENAVKLQVAFKTQKVPDFVKKGAELLARNGRIYTLLIRKNVEYFIEKIKLEKPILYEEMNITMEDIFTIHLADDKIHYFEM